MQLRGGNAAGATPIDVSKPTPAGSEQDFAPILQQDIAAAPAPVSAGVPPPGVQSPADGEPTWVIIGIVIASIAIAVLSLLLLLLLRPCKFSCQRVVQPSAESARSTSNKSTLTQAVDHSDTECGVAPSAAAEDRAGPDSDADAAPALPATLAARNAVDCGRPDAWSAEWERDPHLPDAIEASVHELSRQRIASVLQVSLEQADMYMHNALGHKVPPFRDSSASATSGRSSRSYGVHHGRPIDSLSAASLSAASAAAASSAAVPAAHPQSDLRESQRQSVPSGLYVHSNLSYATSAADPGYGHPQQPDSFGMQQPARGYGSAGVASPQWVHSAGSEASGRGFSMLPGWQEEPQEQTPQRRQTVLPQPHARPQRRRMSSGTQYAYASAWGSVGPGSSGAELHLVNAVPGSSMPPFHPRQVADLHDSDRETLRAAQVDVRRWSAGAEHARERELAERRGLSRDWGAGGHGAVYGHNHVQAGGWTSPGRQAPMQQVAMQQRWHQERLALQHEMLHREAPHW